MPLSEIASTHRGLFVVFEGPDGSGKTTVSSAVGERLAQDGLRLSHASFPGKEPGTLGELVYRLHHNSSELGVPHITAAALQALHIAAHLDAVESRLRPQVLRGECLVLDRYWWSTWVYGMAGGVSENVLNSLIEAEVSMWGTAKPDIIFLVQRASPINREMPKSQYDTLARLYQSLATRERTRQRIITIDNEGDALATVEAAVSELRPHF